MKKRFLSLIIVLLFFILPSSAFAEEPIKVYLNGEKVNFSIDPILDNGRTLVEFRPVFEKLGFVVQWDETNQAVEGKRKSDGLGLKFQIGQYAAEAGYNPFHVLPLVAPARIINGHTLVPLRFVAEVSGKDVNWNGNNRTIKINGSKPVSFNQYAVLPTNTNVSKSSKSSSSKSIKMAMLLTPNTPSTYVVKKGDNLYHIATAHQIPLSTLMQLNDLPSDEIYVGQTLFIPSSGSSIPNSSNPAVSSSPTSAIVTSSNDTTDSPAPVPAVKPTPKRLYPADFVFSSNDPLQVLIRPLLGTPYVYGGNTPDGFDCSGFTAYIFHKLGVTLPRVSADQFTQGQAVDPAEMQEGDLLFYDAAGTGKVNHVALYLGNGYLVHASEKSVVIDTLDHLRKYPLLGVKQFALPLPSTSAVASALPNS